MGDNLGGEADFAGIDGLPDCILELRLGIGRFLLIEVARAIAKGDSLPAGDFQGDLVEGAIGGRVGREARHVSGLGVAQDGVE